MAQIASRKSHIGSFFWQKNKLILLHRVEFFPKKTTYKSMLKNLQISSSQTPPEKIRQISSSRSGDVGSCLAGYLE